MRQSTAASHQRHAINWPRLRRLLWSTVALVVTIRLFNATVFVGDPPDLALELVGIALGGRLAGAILARPVSALADGDGGFPKQQRTRISTRG